MITCIQYRTRLHTASSPLDSASLINHHHHERRIMCGSDIVPFSSSHIVYSGTTLTHTNMHDLPPSGGLCSCPFVVTIAAGPLLLVVGVRHCLSYTETDRHPIVPKHATCLHSAPQLRQESLLATGSAAQLNFKPLTLDRFDRGAGKSPAYRRVVVAVQQ